MPTETNAAENMFIELGKQMFERLIRGEYEYEKDMRTLQIYRERAQRLKSVFLEARMLSLTAILNSISGNVDTAITLLYEAQALLGDNPDYLETRATLLYNLGYTHMNLGEFDKALEIFDNALDLIDTPEDYIGIAYTLYTGRMTTLVYAHRYDHAELEMINFNPLANRYLNESRRDFAKSMMSINQNQARILLARKQADKVRSHALMSRELAEQLKLPAELSEIYLTCARMERMTGDEEAARQYFLMADEQANQVHMPPDIARYLLSGARFLLEDDDLERAKYFAERALAVLEQLGAETGATLAREVITAAEGATIPDPSMTESENLPDEDMP